MIDSLGTVRNLFSLLWGVLDYVRRFLWLSVLLKDELETTALADGKTELLFVSLALEKGPGPKSARQVSHQWSPIPEEIVAKVKELHPDRFSRISGKRVGIPLGIVRPRVEQDSVGSIVSSDV